MKDSVVGCAFRAFALLVFAGALALGCSVAPLDEGVEQVNQSLLGNASCELGIPDLGGTVCCDSSCGSCQESGCTGRSGGATRCCPSKIRTAEVACAHHGPPCIQDPDPLCLNGMRSADNKICCPDFCGVCGGSCGNGVGGSALCCYSGITAGGAPSCSGGSAPCMFDADPDCKGGVEAGGYCCAASCGTCGGSGCPSLPGGRDACCASGILESGRLCSETIAPCRIDGDPDCEAGTVSADGSVCCALSCGGVCGGSGCGNRPGGDQACCVDKIETKNLSCVNHPAPCVLNEAKPKVFVHPGLLNTQAELDTIRQRSAIAGDPIQLGYAKLSENSLSQLEYAYQAYAVLEVLSAASTPSELAIKGDSRAAYAHALRWIVTGDQAYANKAIAIIDAWASTLKRVEPLDANQRRLESAWAAPMFAAAAEILRYATAGSAHVHSGWSAASIDRTERMLRYLAFNAQQTLYKENNWGTSGALAMIAVGTFTDDRRMYDQGVQAWKYLLSKVVNSSGVVNEITRDDDHDVTTTDCDHPQYSVIGFTQAAEIAWHQGTDLYGYRIGSESTSRLLKSVEFMVGLFLGGTYSAGGATYRCPLSDPNPDVTATARPSYETSYNHYRFRTSPSQVSSAFTNFITNNYRPDGTPSSTFLGWSSCTHGELSR